MFSIIPALGCVQQDPCNGAPSISSITLDSEVLNTCAGGGWSVTFDINLNAGLSAQQELYVEHATDSAGTSWSFYGRYGSVDDTVVPVSRSDPEIGSDGTGSSTTRYWKIRAYVVPIGGGTSDACSGPTTGPQESHTTNSCFT